MYRALKFAVAAVGLFALSACGGGGGNRVEATPPPPPPPPPPPASPTLPVTTSQSFETIAVKRDLNGSGIGLSGQVTASGRPSDVRISYDAAAGTYTLVDSNPPQGSASGTESFSAATRTTSGYFDSYTLPDGSKLQLLGNVRAG